MIYQDALDYLHIAENAYNVGAYTESADIVRRLAYYAIDTRNGLTPNQRAEFAKAVQRAINRFSNCPDEAIWEEMCELGDLFA